MTETSGGTHLPGSFRIKHLANQLFGWSPNQPSAAQPPDIPHQRVVHLAVLDTFAVPILLLNAQRVVVEANLAAHELFGARLVNHDLAHSLRHPAALDAASAAIAEGRQSTTPITLLTPVTSYYELHALPVPPDRDAKVRAALILQDVTAAHHVEQMRADFVANVSHELRSPLAALTGFIETLKGPAKDDVAARARFLDIMEVEAHRMGRLIDDLLSLSRVEAKEHLRPKKPVDIAGLLARSRDVLGPRAAERGIPIELDCPPVLPQVAGDADQLYEVFHNLLDNALKYGPSGQPVTIRAQMVERIPEIGGQGLRVCVHNSGDPIAPEHLPRLTERFYRVDKARSRDIGGTGLGLAIVKHIVNRHRGRLSIESSAENGTSFCIYLAEFPKESAPVTQL
ncbi:MAG: sensor histidine kinase [Pseudomonadota bacterium]